jgi:hypothetical protein
MLLLLPSEAVTLPELACIIPAMPEKTIAARIGRPDSVDRAGFGVGQGGLFVIMS